MPPRATRPAGAPATPGPGSRRRQLTVFGRPWPLPVAPWVVGLALLLAVAAGAAWCFEGRFETTPAEAAKRLLPYKADEVQKVVLTSPAGSVTFNRDAAGEFSAGGPPPTPTPVPDPRGAPAGGGAAPLDEAGGDAGAAQQLTIDRVLLEEPSRSPEFGLDAPQMTLEVTPRAGRPGGDRHRGPEPGREGLLRAPGGPGGPRDTVLVTRYSVDDLMKVAGELIAEQGRTG